MDKVNSSDKNTFYRNLLKNINNNNIFLQTANLDNKKENLEISISASDYRNPIQLSSRAAFIAKESSSYDLKTIKVSQINTGVELNSIKYKTSDLDEKYLYIYFAE